MDSTSSASTTFRIEGTPRKFLSGYIGAAFLGVAFLYFYIQVLLRTEMYYTLFFVVPLFGYIFGGLALWIRRGVRVVELDEAGLNIFRGIKKTPVRIDVSQISGVHVTKSIDRTTVTIMLQGATVRRLLGMNFYSGPRVRIIDDAFNPTEFADFANRVRLLRYEASKQ
jgi:hypothetical protein